jgi:hypothetical protein
VALPAGVVAEWGRVQKTEIALDRTDRSDWFHPARQTALPPSFGQGKSR